MHIHYPSTVCMCGRGCTSTCVCVCMATKYLLLASVGGYTHILLTKPYLRYTIPTSTLHEDGSLSILRSNRRY